MSGIRQVALTRLRRRQRIGERLERFGISLSMFKNIFDGSLGTWPSDCQ